MTTTHTTPATLTDASACTGAILASDFSDLVTDRDRHDWTEGKMRHVITAIQDRRVAIVTEKQTGHTVFNVRLVGVIPGYSGRSARVQVEYFHADGTSHLTNHLLFKIGPCITLMPAPATDKRDKHTAVLAWMAERSAASQIAHDLRVAQGLTGGHTTTRLRVHARGVDVHYRPNMDKLTYGTGEINKPENKHWTAYVTLPQIAAELDRRAQQQAAYNAERDAARAAGS